MHIYSLSFFFYPNFTDNSIFAFKCLGSSLCLFNTSTQSFGMSELVALEKKKTLSLGSHH